MLTRKPSSWGEYTRKRSRAGQTGHTARGEPHRHRGQIENQNVSGRRQAIPETEGGGYIEGVRRTTEPAEPGLTRRLNTLPERSERPAAEIHVVPAPADQGEREGEIVKEKKKKVEVKITQDPEKPIPVSILATHIRDVSDSFQKAINAGLTERGLVLLIHDASGVGKPDIRKILDALPDLKRLYTRA